MYVFIKEQSGKLSLNYPCYPVLSGAISQKGTAFLLSKEAQDK